MVNHAPVTEPAIGSSLTVETLMQAMVEVSDNPAANLLLKALGGIAPMQAFYRGIGDAITRVDRFEPEMNRLDGDKDTITPAQSAANIHRLFIDPASPLSQDSKAHAARLDVLLADRRRPHQGRRPAGWRVAHKTGTGGYGPTNDIGILYPPSGEPIIVAAYYHATRETTDAQNAAVIAEATRMALAALGARMTDTPDHDEGRHGPSDRRRHSRLADARRGRHGGRRHRRHPAADPAGPEIPAGPAAGDLAGLVAC